MPVVGGTLDRIDETVPAKSLPIVRQDLPSG